MRRISVIICLVVLGSCVTPTEPPENGWDTRLHEALDVMPRHSTDASGIETLLGSGADANARDETGHSAIWKAIDRQRYDVVELLLENGARPDTLDATEIPDRTTPLCYLISIGRHYGPSSPALEAMRALLGAGAKAGATCFSGQSALVLALEIGNHRSLQVLADAGIRVSSEAELSAASSALAIAASQSEDETLAALIALGADVNRKPPDQARPLEAALHDGYRASTALLLLEAGAIPVRSDAVVTAVERMIGDLPLVDALIAAGADPNGADALGQTALIVSIRRAYVEVVQLLLAAGVDPNQSESKLQHPLHLLFQVSEDQRLPIAELLIAAGADIHARDGSDRTVLMRAASGHDSAYTKLAIASGANLEATTQSGQTAADLAVTSGAKLELLELLGNTAEEKRDNIGNRLSRAVRHRSLAELQGLIDQGIDLDVRGEENRTALETAGRYGYHEIFQALLDGGANPDVYVLDGSALQYGNIYISAMNLRRQRGLDEDTDARIPLIASAFLAGNFDMIERLLKAGADPDILSATGDSTLHLAHAGNRMLRQGVRVLLEGGADPNLTNVAGFTPMTLAAKNRSMDLMRALLDNGVDVNAVDREGRTALGQTIEHGVSLRDKEELIERGAIPTEADVAMAHQNGNHLLFRLISDARN